MLICGAFVVLESLDELLGLAKGAVYFVIRHFAVCKVVVWITDSVDGMSVLGRSEVGGGLSAQREGLSYWGATRDDGEVEVKVGWLELAWRTAWDFAGGGMGRVWDAMAWWG